MNNINLEFDNNEIILSFNLEHFKIFLKINELIFFYYLQQLNNNFSQEIVDKINELTSFETEIKNERLYFKYKAEAFRHIDRSKYQNCYSLSKENIEYISKINLPKLEILYKKTINKCLDFDVGAYDSCNLSNYYLKREELYFYLSRLENMIFDATEINARYCKIKSCAINTIIFDNFESKIENSQIKANFVYCSSIEQIKDCDADVIIFADYEKSYIQDDEPPSIADYVQEFKNNNYAKQFVYMFDGMYNDLEYKSDNCVYYKINNIVYEESELTEKLCLDYAVIPGNFDNFDMDYPTIFHDCRRKEKFDLENYEYNNGLYFPFKKPKNAASRVN